MSARAKKTPRAPRAPRSPQIETDVLLPAIVIDANYLQGLALNMRTAISAGVLPGILETCKTRAEHGEMDALIAPGSTNSITPQTFCEALQPELHRLGMRTEIVRQQIPRLGMVEEKTALVISWRDIA